MRWDDRYNIPDYLFGTEPNSFLASSADLLKPGQKALCIADGEGRNSVWLASRGLAVTAFDASTVGLDKAKRLAADKGVHVDYHLATIEDWEWTGEYFDVVAAIFIQFAPPDLRAKIFAGIKKCLKPGGLFLLEGYGPKQLEYGTGGPRILENLYTRALLEDAFGDFEIILLDEYDAEVREGSGHSGKSALVDLVARKATGR